MYIHILDCKCVCLCVCRRKICITVKLMIASKYDKHIETNSAKFYYTNKQLHKQQNTNNKIHNNFYMSATISCGTVQANIFFSFAFTFYFVGGEGVNRLQFGCSYFMQIKTH